MSNTVETEVPHIGDVKDVEALANPGDRQHQAGCSCNLIS
jgi:hypothetical protein